MTKIKDVYQEYLKRIENTSIEKSSFDILFENIEEDKGKQAYFVFADIPSDMYIYDEFCKIRPQTEWINRTNLPWIKRDCIVPRQGKIPI